MHRRHFLSLVIASALGPRFLTALQFEAEESPPPDRSAPTWDAIRFRTLDADAMIRTIEVRVSIWDDAAMAGTVAGSLTANAGTALPAGEFYHSAVTDWTPPVQMEDAEEITGREWNTVVGVAAFTTCWAQFVAWQDRRVTVVLVSGGAPVAVRREASRLADLVLYWEPMPCGPPPDTLPTIDEVPPGMELVWRADEEGPWTVGEVEDDGRVGQVECTMVDDPG
jgi:hypothetical protein